MKYMILIYSDEKASAGATPEQWQAVMAAYMAYGSMLTAKGAEKGNNALLPTAGAMTVRVRGGKNLVTAGPFAETKEQLGGYYLIEAKDMDEAIALAAACPGAAAGCVEVRQIMEF